MSGRTAGCGRVTAVPDALQRDTGGYRRVTVHYRKLPPVAGVLQPVTSALQRVAACYHP